MDSGGLELIQGELIYDKVICALIYYYRVLKLLVPPCRLLQRAPSLHCGMRELQRRHGLHSLHAMIGLRVPLQWSGSGVREGGVEVTARACRVHWV